MDGSPQTHPETTALSRRRFLRNAAVAVGTAAALQAGGVGTARQAAAEVVAGGLPGDGVITAVARARNHVLAVGHDDRGQVRVWRRDDGEHEWVGISPGGDFDGARALGVAAAESAYVIVGFREVRAEVATAVDEDGHEIPIVERHFVPASWTSPDGSAWTVAETPDISAVALDIASSSAGLLAVGAELDGETSQGVAPFVMSSEDGRAWRRVSTNGLPDTPEGGLQGVARRGQTWYTLSSDLEEAAIWASADGASWSEHVSFPAGDAPAALAQGPGGLVAVGATVPDAQPRYWRVTGSGASEQRMPSAVPDTAILRDLAEVERGRVLLVGQHEQRPLAVDAEQ